MDQLNIKIFCWNSWFEAQNGKRYKKGVISRNLNYYLRAHSPDIIFINEVFFDKNNQSEVVNLLRKNNYQTNFSGVITTFEGETIGNVFATKHKINSIKTVKLKTNRVPHIKWYKEFIPYFTEVDMQVKDQDIKFIGIHLCVMLPRDWFVHIMHRLAFNKELKKYPKDKIFIVGDFNELKLLHKIFNLSLGLKSQTGNFLNPTALISGKRRNIFWFNTDYVMWPRKPKVKLIDFRVLNNSKSDHRPILSEFRL